MQVDGEETDGPVGGTAAALAAVVSIAQEHGEEAVLRRAVTVGCSLLHAGSGHGWLGSPDGGSSLVVVESCAAGPAAVGEDHPPLVAPVATEQEPLGWLTFTPAPGARPFSPRDRRVAESLGRQSGAVIARVRARLATDAVLTALDPIGTRAGDPPPVAGEASPTIRRLLGSARALLGMDLTFLSHVADGRQTFDAVDAGTAAPALRPGTTIDADEGYCSLLLDDAIPAAVPDVPAHPLLGALAVTADLRIGAYCGVPVRLPDGSLYGTLCGLHSRTTTAPDPARMDALRLVAGLVGECLHDERLAAARQEERRAALRSVIAGRCRRTVVQPIVDLRDGTVVGQEALTRFGDAGEAPVPADRVFADARELGLSVQLEQATARDALALLPALQPGTYLSVNLSPAALLHPGTDALLAAVPAPRLVVEITEHEAVTDYAAVRQALAAHRARGVRLAVDDTGAGFASLYHLTQLGPDVIKLDGAFVRGLLHEPACRAVAAAVAGYATEVGAVLVAEGVETAEQAAALRDLGVGFGQGYHFGHPREPVAGPAHRSGLPGTLGTPRSGAVADLPPGA
ncbi:EAL domain-containing protein [Geodermatophilus sp. DSM 44513]|uniref:sensor domain-containing phosphodiesterase n=1 Tax=Geodermatophilus sp. DSM 44513 TaxID=1528104 RepID=UPI00127A8616|nr:EAL domain-containing protein [Geodermatophilus sp. DSM 44513]WNV75591.1 EAL domain-containing protein [Geodermatophilus sp. DSM 44513]